MSRHFRSATEFCFREEQKDAIVRTVAYHRKDFGLSVIWFSPHEHVDIRQSVATPFPRTSSAGLGFLDALPLELLHDVLMRLDMHSLFKFRQMNLRSRQITDSLKQYQMVVSHGLNLLCALLRTRLAIDVSLFDFFDALITKTCAFCGEFGGFIFLLSWSRCCFKCIREGLGTKVQSLAAIRKRFHLTKVKSCQLKSFKTLPGIYTMNESIYKARILVGSVHQAEVTFGEPPQVRVQALPPDLVNRKLSFMASCELPYHDVRNVKIERGMSCAGCQFALENDIIGTRGERWAFETRDKVYAQDGFLEHFRWCEQAQLLWISSGEGETRPIQLPEGVRRGGYFHERE